MALTSKGIDAQGLHRFFHAGDEEVVALRDVSLRVDPGEVVAIVGPSGSGKSTLLACLAGLDEPDGGTVTIDGVRLSRRTEAERCALRARTIGVLLQAGNLVDHLSLDANLRMAQQLAGRPDRSERRAALERVGLGDRGGARPATLSGGEAARAGLALATINGPAVLLADEPTGEVDTENEQRVLALVRREADRGAAVVLVTHSPVAAAFADRTHSMHDGRLA